RPASALHVWGAADRRLPFLCELRPTRGRNSAGRGLHELRRRGERGGEVLRRLRSHGRTRAAIRGRCGRASRRAARSIASAGRGTGRGRMTGAPTRGDPPGPSCPRCGAPFGPDQEYCLECGLRLGGNRNVLRTLEAAWRGRFDSYPGDWIWPVLVGLVIAVAGATAAIVLGASKGGGGGT